MEVARDAMLHVVEPRCRRLANTARVVAVPAAVGEPRNHRGTHQALAVDDVVVAERAHRARHRPADGGDLPPRRWRKQHSSPAAGRNRNEGGDGGVHGNQGREGLLDDPGKPCLRPLPPRLRQRRHMMDHVAKRGTLDEQDVGHFQTPRLCGPYRLVIARQRVHSRLRAAVAGSNAKGHESASSMTVLVTGGAGYIGSPMVYALLDAGERVVVLDNLATGFDWAVAHGATLLVGNAGDQALVAALVAKHQIETIIHFAASVVVPDSVRDPLG